MKYDFDKPVKRYGTDSMKWEVGEKELPMWVADMDFPTAPEIREALMNRVGHGVFGYALIPDEWYDAYISWWKERHSLEIEKESLIFTTGVVPAISSAVRKLTTPGEKVLIQSPVYNIFYNSIVNNGRHILECPLDYDGREYAIDFEELEKKLSDPQTTLMILCNPHNPVGKIWDRETLSRIGDLCIENHVVVLSDEIHCDLTDPGTEYVPFASVSENCRLNSVTCLAPTKAFNLAGLQTAAVMVPGERLRNKMNRALNTDEIAEPNSFATTAAITAFTRGGAWLDELREYLAGNKALVRSRLEEKIPGVKAVPSEATYLLWLDCRSICEDSGELYEYLRRETGLYLTDGAHYGSGGEGFLRMNVACPRSVVEEGLDRLERGIAAFTSRNSENMTIKVTAQGKTVIFTLNDSQAAKDLYDQLPLTIGVENFSSDEKIFYPPQKLNTAGTPRANAKVGTLAYYAPWGDVVMFYGNFGSASGLYELGQTQSGEQFIRGMSGTITIEKD